METGERLASLCPAATKGPFIFLILSIAAAPLSTLSMNTLS